MGVERNHRFACEIVALHEGVQNHRQIAPPDRIAKEDCVIFVEAADGIADYGTLIVGALSCCDF